MPRFVKPPIETLYPIRTVRPTIACMIQNPPAPIGQSNAPSVATIQEIRSQFPALEREHHGNPVAYFDGPGGTQTPRCVAEAMTDYLYHHNANTHWKYPTSAETDEMIGGARQALADLVNGRPEEIAFGANATTLAFQVSRAILQQMGSGDEIIVTELDHHANVGPWQLLARESGCTIRTVKLNCEDGTLDWDDFEKAVGKRTKLVAIGAASNALGTINDVQRAVRLARAVGALVFVDAVHYVPHHLADVRAMDCDFLVCSAYKFYGPHIGALWCREELLESLPFAKVQPSPDSAPERAETGTLNHEGMAGAAAAVDFLASLVEGAKRRENLQAAYAMLEERAARLTERMWNGLSDIGGVRLYGPPLTLPRTSTVAFTIDGVASSEVARRLAVCGVFVSHGNFYAATVIERLGLGREGLVRAGCACYTSEAEIDRLVKGVRQIGQGV
jgi:cysteine desulfurase family protein (TIGR01976 family)